MKLSDLNKIFFILIIFLNYSHLKAEEEVDIWKKDNLKTNQEVNEEKKIDSPLINKNLITTNSIIQEQPTSEKNDNLLYGIWDPDKYNFELSMWSNTDGANIEKTISRISKLQLSETAENIFQNTLFSYSYAPEHLDEKAFLDINQDG